MKIKLAFLVLCGSWIATLVRIWPSDRWPLIAVLAYIPALLLLIAGLFNLILISSMNQHHRRARWLYLNWLLIVSNFLLVAADNRQFFRSSNSIFSEKSLRILHWNVWGSRNGYERIAAEICRHQPAIVCLSEPILHPLKQDYPRYDHLLGGSWQTWGRGNMLVLSKLPFTKREFFGDQYMKGMYLEIPCNPPLSLLFLDLDTDLTHFRRQAFNRLSHFMAEKRWNPAVILGDLNTPAHSFSLQEAFLRDHNDSYFSAGRGIGYTWAFWLPMARIDLIYVRHDRKVFGYEAFSSRLSDHRMHLIDIDLNPSADIR